MNVSLNVFIRTVYLGLEFSQGSRTRGGGKKEDFLGKWGGNKGAGLLGGGGGQKIVSG